MRIADLWARLVRPWSATVLLLLAGCSSPKPASQNNPVPTPAPVLTHKQTPASAKAASKPQKENPNRRDAHRSLLGKWVDEQGTVYNFRTNGEVTWSHPVGSTAANFEGRYTLTEGQLVIIPRQASSPEGRLNRQLGSIKSKHRLTEYMLLWKSNGSLTLSGPDGQLSLSPIQ